MEKFGYAMFLANELYDLELLPDDFEEIGLVAFNRIGNKRQRLYRYCTEVDCETNTIKLPCNCDEIEAITYGFEDWNFVSNMYPNGDSYSSWVEDYIEARKAFENPLYISGRFVRYERVGDTLYLDGSYKGKIFILYRGDILDDDGLPEITEEEADAIATFCAYTLKFKDAIKNNNPNTMKMAEYLKREWLVKCSQARVPKYISQNEWNEILDAKVNWNRKIYNKSYKPLK